MNDVLSSELAKVAALRKEAERLEEDSTYSSKGHFNAADTWVRRHYFLGVPATILGAIAGATLIRSQPELATCLTLLASLLTGLMTFLKPNEQASMHRTAAGQFLALRKDLHFFREVELLDTKKLNEMPGKLKALLSSCNELNQKSPSIPRRAFVAARRGIEDGEATNKIDSVG